MLLATIPVGTRGTSNATKTAGPALGSATALQVDDAPVRVEFCAGESPIPASAAMAPAVEMLMVVTAPSAPNVVITAAPGAQCAMRSGAAGLPDNGANPAPVSLETENRPRLAKLGGGFTSSEASPIWTQWY